MLENGVLIIIIWYTFRIDSKINLNQWIDVRIVNEVVFFLILQASSNILELKYMNTQDNLTYNRVHTGLIKTRMYEKVFRILEKSIYVFIMFFRIQNKVFIKHIHVTSQGYNYWWNNVFFIKSYLLLFKVLYILLKIIYILQNYLFLFRNISRNIIYFLIQIYCYLFLNLILKHIQKYIAYLRLLIVNT